MRFCPRCESEDVVADMSTPAMSATGLFNTYHLCNKCGYSGVLFPEKD